MGSRSGTGAGEHAELERILPIQVRRGRQVAFMKRSLGLRIRPAAPRAFPSRRRILKFVSCTASKDQRMVPRVQGIRACAVWSMSSDLLLRLLVQRYDKRDDCCRAWDKSTPIEPCSFRFPALPGADPHRGALSKGPEVGCGSNTESGQLCAYSQFTTGNYSMMQMLHQCRYQLRYQLCELVWPEINSVRTSLGEYTTLRLSAANISMESST